MPFLWEADVRERFAYPAASGVPGSGVGAVVSVTGVCCTPQAVVNSMVSARQTAGTFFIHIASLYIKTRETWVLDKPRGVAASDGVGGYVARDHAVGRHNGSVADFHAGHDHALAAEPDVVADDRVALARELGHVVGRRFSPRAAEDVEGVGARTAGWPNPL